MLSSLDWYLIFAYLALALALVVGVWTSRAASRGLASYFVADRSLPGWWVGTSMVATTFASDTPLVVAGIVAARGISGNWFWWSWIIGNIGVAIFFAPLWRRLGVVTDAEMIECRYGAGVARGRIKKPRSRVCPGVFRSIGESSLLLRTRPSTRS